RIYTSVIQPDELKKALSQADLAIGALNASKGRTPCVVTEEMVSDMKYGSVIIDISIDQGGCFETSKPTTHAEPIYVVDNVIHYCVANMPGALPLTSTYALSNATLPYALALANKGWKKALSDNSGLAKGLNVHNGQITYKAVAQAHGMASVEMDFSL
ncbi:MAG: alanine dehydrogenase, partial [Actinomycetota bacterium]